MKLTREEKGILAICRLNKTIPRQEIIKKWKIGKLEIIFKWKSKHNIRGRFGGGWNWNFGFQASKGSIILNLLVCTLRFDW